MDEGVILGKHAMRYRIAIDWRFVIKHGYTVKQQFSVKQVICGKTIIWGKVEIVVAMTCDSDITLGEWIGGEKQWLMNNAICNCETASEGFHQGNNRGGQHLRFPTAISRRRGGHRIGGGFFSSEEGFVHRRRFFMIG